MNCKIIEDVWVYRLEQKINEFIRDLHDCNVSITSNVYMIGDSSKTQYIACITWK